MRPRGASQMASCFSPNQCFLMSYRIYMCLAKSWCKCGYTRLLKGSELVALQNLACEAMHGLGGLSQVCWTWLTYGNMVFAYDL